MIPLTPFIAFAVLAGGASAFVPVNQHPYSASSLFAVKIQAYGATSPYDDGTLTRDDGDAWPYNDDAMARNDTADDSEFYERTRLVNHVDEWAVMSIENFYREEIQAECLDPNNDDGKVASGSEFRVDVLDLCSSWVSHLPQEDAFPLGNVVGIGMNDEELRANSRLTKHIVQDLNINPSFDYFPDESFDVVLCSLSVDYLIRPREVFLEIQRVLRPGGVVLIAFGNRYFGKKTVKVWLDTDAAGRMDIVATYLHSCGEQGTWSSIDGYDIKLHRSADTILQFVGERDLFRWFATAIFRGTWKTDDIFAVKAKKTKTIHMG